MPNIENDQEITQDVEEVHNECVCEDCECGCESESDNNQDVCECSAEPCKCSDEIMDPLDLIGTSQDPDVIHVFTIPEEMATALSELLSTSEVRYKLLLNAIDQPTKYASIEKKIIEVDKEIADYKAAITRQYVPKAYRSQKYTWYFAGHELKTNEVWIRYS